MTIHPLSKRRKRHFPIIPRVLSKHVSRDRRARVSSDFGTRQDKSPGLLQNVPATIKVLNSWSYSTVLRTGKPDPTIAWAESIFPNSKMGVEIKEHSQKRKMQRDGLILTAIKQQSLKRKQAQFIPSLLSWLYGWSKNDKSEKKEIVIQVAIQYNTELESGNSQFHLA